MEKNLFGNHPVSRSPPPAFASEPLMYSGRKEHNGGNLPSEENDATSTSSSSLNHEGNFMKSASPAGPGATTRKGATQIERQNSEVSYYANDEDVKRKKYSKRGTIRHKFLRSLVPFWSSSLPTLPVTAPAQKDASCGVDASDGRGRRHRTLRMDPRKLLLIILIM